MKSFIILIIVIVIAALTDASWKKSSAKNTIPEDFDGIFRYTLFGGKEAVYCPRCKSSNCQWFVETHHTDAVTKTKTQYKANLNPLKPFTLVNKKEKVEVISPERNTTVRKILCNNCGYVFR